MREMSLKVNRRFKKLPHSKGKANMIGDDHPAVIEGRTLFPSRVRSALYTGVVLKRGEHQRKIGSHVVKGRWAGMPIFTLTLEERATCPRTCKHWNDCYGSNMPFPLRWSAGADLENKLRDEVPFIAHCFPGGFVVRLHILGDFYSVEYVDLWRHLMEDNDALHVFGYTARTIEDPIGARLQQVRNAFPDRWWVRWSDQDQRTMLSTGDSGIICPVQTGRTECCATCALCWTVEKPIRFLSH